MQHYFFNNQLVIGEYVGSKSFFARAAWVELDFGKLADHSGAVIESWFEPGLGPSKEFSAFLSMGRAVRIAWREFQPQYVEIFLEYGSSFKVADLQCVADLLHVDFACLNKESGQIVWE